MSEGFRKIGDAETRKSQIVRETKDRKSPSIRRQCELLGITRSVIYHKKKEETQETIDMMNIMDKEHHEHPNYGTRSYVNVLRAMGFQVGRVRIRRLMNIMNLEAMYPKKNLSNLGRAKYVMPYLLRHKKIEHSNQVWSIDITYIRMRKGFMYQIAIIDVFSRFVVGWKLSNSLDRSNVLEVIKQAVAKYGTPDIINSDQGAQFTCHEWVDTVKSLGIEISMDGRGRCLDNPWIERFWRSLKREYIYICPEDNVENLRRGVEKYIQYYNNERPHQGINNCKPREWYEYAA